MTLEIKESRDVIIDIYKKQKINLVPIPKGEGKRLSVSWTRYQTEKYISPIPNDQDFAVICGESSENLVVLDFDECESIDVFRDIVSDVLNKTLVSRTGDGYHVYLKLKGKLPKTKTLWKNGQKLEVRSHGAYVIGISSEHYELDKNTKRYFKTGKIYTTASNTTTIKQLDIDGDVFLKQIISSGWQEKKDESMTDFNKWNVEDLLKGNWARGERRRKQKSLYCKLRRDKNQTVENIIKTITEINQKLSEPLDENELQVNFDSAESFFQNEVLAKFGYLELKQVDENTSKAAILRELRQSRSYNVKEFALAAADIKGRHHFLTVEGTDQVYIFKEKVYDPNGAERIRELCQEMIYGCKKGTTLEVIDWIRRDKTYIKPELLFNNYIINTESGILDPVTFELKPHGPEYYTVATLPFKVDRNAKNYKLWNHILTIIDAKDSFLILELLWMFISWRNPHKKMFVFKGPSNSQKTSLVHIIEQIVGYDNLAHQRPETFLARDARFASSKFIGKRGNIASEIGNLTKEHLENQKSFVGAEKQNTEKKNDNAEYIFDPEHFTFLYSTNTLNAIYSSIEDSSVISRYQFIMFNNVIVTEKQDGEWFNKMFTDDQDRETAISTVINIMLDYKRAQKAGKAKKTKFASVQETKKILQDLKPKVDKFFEDEDFLTYTEGSKIDITEVTKCYENYTGQKLKNGNLDMGHILRARGYKTKHSNSKTWVQDTAFGKPETNEEITKYAK